MSGNTSRANRNFYGMLKFTELPKTPGITSKKHPLPEGNKLFSGYLHAHLDEPNADMVQFTKR